MRRLPALALSTLALTPALALLPTPAQAGSSATNVTFTVSGGSLTVSAPASKTLSAATLSLTGASISGQHLQPSLVTCGDCTVRISLDP